MTAAIQWKDNKYTKDLPCVYIKHCDVFVYKGKFMETKTIVMWLCIWKLKSYKMTQYKQIVYPPLKRAFTSDLNLPHSVALCLRNISD